MPPKGKKVERKEENISLGPQIREGTNFLPHSAWRGDDTLLNPVLVLMEMAFCAE